MAEFHENLKAMRLQSKMTQQQVSDAMGMDVSNYSKIEAGKGDPRLSTIKKIGDVFHVSPGVFHEPLRVMVPEAGARMIPMVDSWTLVQWLDGRLPEEKSQQTPVAVDLRGKLFGFVQAGESMAPEIRDSDLVIVERQKTAAPGNLVVAHDGARGYLRRYSVLAETDGEVTMCELLPLNPYYGVLRSDKTPFEIVGVCIRHLKNLVDW